MNELRRANRITVIANEGGSYKADLWKTHKLVQTVHSPESGWMPNPDDNKTAQREGFRRWVIDHAGDYGVLWSPEDKRAESNVRKSCYKDIEDISEDVGKMLVPDIDGFLSKCPYELDIYSITVDDVTPMQTTPKGTPLESMGVVDGKYAKSGNWAWATVYVTITARIKGQELYLPTTIQLVSGQLKKPTTLGDGGYTQTGWNTALKQEMVLAGILVEEEKPSTEEKPVEATKEDKPKKPRKSKKAADAQ